MKVYLVGMGCGNMYTMTAGAVKIIRQSDLIIGASRLLEGLPEDWEGQREAAVSAEEICERITEFKSDCEEDANVCVIFSGDTGFYSGARNLLPLLEEKEIDYETIPGISSVQLLSARLGMPWQDWKLVSAHGTDVNVVTSLDDKGHTFFLTGGKFGPAEICIQLCEADLGDLRVVIAERLSYDDEKIHKGRAAEFTGMDFDSLSVLLADPVTFAVNDISKDFRPGLPDMLFVRGDVPMTKRDIRAVISAHMQIRSDDIIWDVGAGTGSVTIEMAIQASSGRVYAIERDYDGVVLIDQNAERFGLTNIEVVGGEAPAVLVDLPAPDRVFIGGSGGNLEEIIRIVVEKNPGANICLTAIMIETASAALTIMNDMGMETEITQVAVSSGRKTGQGHMMIASNPIYVVTGRGN